MHTIAAPLRDRLIEWRDAPEGNAYKVVGRVAASEVALLVLTGVALVESVVYGVFTGLSALFYGVYRRPFEAGWRLLQESVSTLGSLCVDVAYRNFVSPYAYQPFVQKVVLGRNLVAAQIEENIQTAESQQRYLRQNDQNAWDWSLFILREVIVGIYAETHNLNRVTEVIEGIESVDAPTCDFIFSEIIQLFVEGAHRDELLPDFLSDTIQGLIQRARRQGQIEQNYGQGKWFQDKDFHRACQFVAGVFKHPDSFLYDLDQEWIQKNREQNEADRALAQREQEAADAQRAAQLAGNGAVVLGPADAVQPLIGVAAAQAAARRRGGVVVAGNADLSAVLAASRRDAEAQQRAREAAALAASLQEFQERAFR